MYYWDGQAWRSTLSADGRFRWDGSAWTPVNTMVAAPYGGIAAPRREPTSWTRPIQYSVIAWYLWSIAFVLSEPFWLGGVANGIVNQSFQRQQQLNPEVSPPPQAVLDMMSNIMSASIVLTAFVYAAVFVVIIVGAWKRWVWMYWVVLVLLGLTSLLLPIQLVSALVTLPNVSSRAITLPGWVQPVQILTSLPAVALFVWMLVALIKRGPWAMRRPQSF